MCTLRILAFCGLALSLGCVGQTSTQSIKGGGGGKIKVAFVTNNPEAFWNIAEAGCRKAEAEFGVEVVFRRPDSGDPARQREIIDDVMQQGVKAIAVSVVDPEKQRSHLDGVAQKVKLITQDNDAPKTGRLAYIGTNNYVAGRAVGKLLKEALPQGGKLAVFVGQTEPLNARQRRQGVLDELSGKAAPADINAIEYSPDGPKYGSYELVGTFTDQPKGAAESKEKAVTFLNKLGDNAGPVAMVGLWAYNPPAILSAVRETNKLGKVTIIGFDEDDATLQGIRDGHIHATVVQDPFNFGYRSVKLMVDLVQKGDEAKPADPMVYVPERVIAKEAAAGKLAVGPFAEELNKLRSGK